MRSFDAILIDELEEQISNDEQTENFDDISMIRFLIMRVNRIDTWVAVRGAVAWLILCLFGFIGISFMVYRSLLSRFDFVTGIGQAALFVALLVLFLISMLLFLVSYDIRRFEYGIARYHTYKVSRQEQGEPFLYEEIDAQIPSDEEKGFVITKLVKYFVLANLSLFFGHKDLSREYNDFKVSGFMRGTKRRLLRDETCYEPGVFYEKVVACYKDRIKETGATRILVAFPLGFMTAFTMMLLLFYAIVLPVLIFWGDLGFTPIIHLISRFEVIYSLLVVIVTPLFITGVFFVVVVLNTLFAPIAFDLSMNDMIGRKGSMNRLVWTVASFLFAFIIGVRSFIDYYKNDWENVMDDDSFDENKF